VTSTYLGSTYAVISGTSMATPHVAGAAALVMTRPIGAWDSDGDGSWDPAEVQAKLEATAEDLGLDAAFQGAGLVRADAAVQ
jgi:subtilisin family serine protease